MILGLGIVAAVRDPTPTASDEPAGEDEMQERADAQPTTTTAPEPLTTTVEPLRGSVAPDGPVLGETTGWFVISADRSGLVRIDADTGELTELGVNVVPMGYVGDQIALRSFDHRIYLVDPALLAGPVPLSLPSPINARSYAGGSGTNIFASRHPDRLWVELPVINVAVEIRLSDGAELQRIAQSDYALFGGQSGPEFLTPPTGGVYRLEDDGSYSQAATGRVIAVVDGGVLVRQCDETLTCQNQWLDPNTLEERTDWFAPEANEANVWGQKLLGNDRFLLSFETQLIDIRNGDRFTLPIRWYSMTGSGPIDVSPNGNTIMISEPDGLLMMSTSTGATSVVKYEHQRVAGRLVPVFVAKPPTVDDSSG